MELNNDLVTQFAKITKFNTAKSATTVRGTIRTSNDRNYIQIDGADKNSKTPVETTVEVFDGDRVIATVKDHSVIVTGNKTNPSVGVKTADGLRSSIEQTAEAIRTEVADEVKGLNSTITQTAAEINTRIDNLGSGDTGEFTEFKQTVEGFYFIDEDGTVYIDGGSVYAKNLNLSGAITWNDLDANAKDAITAIDTAAGDAKEAADEAYDKAVEAYNLANGIDVTLPSYIKSTYIDSTTIQSPDIIGGRLYAVGSDPNVASTFSVMDENGFYIYYDGDYSDADNDADRLIPKMSLRTDSTGREIMLVLGSGENANNEWYNRFYISKQTNRVDAMYVTEYDGGGLGFTMLKNSDEVVVHGTLGGSTGLFPIGYIYLSTDTTSPAELFGGSWSRLSGYFLYATGSDSKVDTAVSGGVVTAGGTNSAAYINVAAWERVG